MYLKYLPWWERCCKNLLSFLIVSNCALAIWSSVMYAYCWCGSVSITISVKFHDSLQLFKNWCAVLITHVMKEQQSMKNTTTKGHKFHFHWQCWMWTTLRTWCIKTRMYTCMCVCSCVNHFFHFHILSVLEPSSSCLKLCYR